MVQYDFTGGYATSLSPELHPGNMLLAGTNLYWKGELQKRPAWTNLSTDATIHANTVRGFTRAYINGGWYNVVALDDGTDVNFYYGNTGAYTAISGSYGFTKDINVEMVFFNDSVIAVNGTDKPAIIYYSSGWVVKDLEAYDERTRGTDEWYAGLWDDGASAQFIDDTTDAQSTTADDLLIATGGTNNDGFYVAGVVPFTKVVIKNCPQFDGSPVAEYAYYAGSGTWTTVTPTTTPSWTAAEGDKTLEFAIPLDTDGSLLWEKYGDVASQVDAVDSSGDTYPGGALNRYIFRVRFTTAPTSNMSADYLQVSHTQYLSQIMLNDRPQAVAVHNNRLFLGVGNAFFYTEPHQVDAWEAYNVEYCTDGGKEILQMVSVGDYLAIVKPAAIYGYYGTTPANFVLRSVGVEGGVSKRGATTASGILAYVATDGIRAFVNEKSVRISRHIQSDYDSWTKTNAAVASWDGNFVFAFPTDDVILWCDPDTIRQSQNDAGEGVGSFWKWTGLTADALVYANGGGDSDYLILHDSTNKRFVYDTTTAYDTDYDTTTDNIAITFETKDYTESTPGFRKTGKRLLLDLSPSGDWTLTLSADGGARTATMTLESGTGSYHYRRDIALPYTLDGYSLRVKLENDTANAVKIYGFSNELERRSF